VVPAHGKELVKTDLSIAIPRDTYARIAPRSGLAWKHFIDTGAGVVVGRRSLNPTPPALNSKP
jgi:dUTP pyrophosphatase